MNSRNRLLKCLTMVYRNNKLGSNSVDIKPALDLVKESLSSVNLADGRSISEQEGNIHNALLININKLQAFNQRKEVLDDIGFILSDLEAAMPREQDFYDVIESALRGVEEGSTDTNSLRSIQYSEIATLTHDIMGAELGMDIYRVSQEVTNTVKTGGDVSEVISEFMAMLETKIASFGSDTKSLLLDYVDLADNESVDKLIDDIHAKIDGGAVLQFGWQGLNKALQGGIRLGQTMGVCALQHSNKSGITLGMFRHLAIYNTPVVRNKHLEPCLVRISFEDDLTDNYQFLFKDLMYDVHRKEEEFMSYDRQMVRDTVTDELTKNGWRIIIAKGNPSDWNVLKIQTFVNKLISEGLDPQLVMIDYLSKVPTVGCDRTGAMGTDHRDMLRRMRNYFNGIKCAFITPFQLNTAAKGMLSNGIAAQDLLDEIAGGGFTANSRQLDQELDISLLTHIVKKGKEGNFQQFLVDKHRHSNYIDAVDKRFFLRLPDNFMPLPSDIDKEDTTIRRISMPAEGHVYGI